MTSKPARFGLLLAAQLLFATAASRAEDWLQYKFDSRHSGNAPERSVAVPPGLISAVPLTDAVSTAPVVAHGCVYVVDGAGVAFCIDADTFKVKWKYETRGGKANCSNVSSPAVVGRYLHFGTMAGSYYVLDAASGKVVNEIRCGEPIFSTPVVADGRAYFATLGSKVYALRTDGEVCWKWDYVKERLGFGGDRWSGEQWAKFKKGPATWRDQFCCSRNLGLYDNIVVLPAGGETVFLEDSGNEPQLRGIGVIGDVYRCRPQQGFGLCLHSLDDERRDGLRRPPALQTQPLGGYPSISSPILLRDSAVYGGLDGSLYVVPLDGKSDVWSFKTGFGKAISAPVAVCDGRI